MAEQQEQSTEQVTSKKEKGQMRREEKRQGFERKARARKTKKITIWVVVILVIAAGIYYAVITAQKSQENRPGEFVKTLSATHIPQGADHKEYNSNPPTSGEHFASAYNWGIYREELIDEQALHNLEHGGIWISYKNITDAELDELKDIALRYSRRVILSPRSSNDTNIAVASWGRLLKMGSVDTDLITSYVKKNTNKSPERLAQ